MAVESFNHGEARDVAGTVADVHHVLEGDSLVFLFHGVVDAVGPPPQFVAGDAFADGMGELGLFGEGDGTFDGGGPAVGLVFEGAAKDVGAYPAEAGCPENVLDTAAEDLPLDGDSRFLVFGACAETLLEPPNEVQRSRIELNVLTHFLHL